MRSGGARIRSVVWRRPAAASSRASGGVRWLLLWVPCAIAGAGLVAGPGVLAQEPAFTGALTTITLPGGVRAALAALRDPTRPDRGHFLLELVRRSYRTPIGASDPHDPMVRSLITHLDAATAAADPAMSDTLPLPLTADLWISAVFGGRETPGTLARGILGSRNASLLYFGLVGLDDATRAWLEAHPAFVTELATQHASTFVLAAPGLRISDGALQVPGGPRAAGAWEALVGRPIAQPVDFIRALLTEREGMLAYYFGALAQLSPAQLTFILDLDAADPAARVGAARRLQAVFERIASGWSIGTRTFWRPALDPALLVSDLPVDESGRPRLPGTRQFWDAVFGDEPRWPADAPGARPATAPQRTGETAVDFAWLADRVFQGDISELRRRYNQVLFAARTLPPDVGAGRADAVAAVRTFASFPALAAALERAQSPLGVYGTAARRAAKLSQIDDDARAIRGITQFQGLVALIMRAGSKGSLTSEAVASHVTAVSAIDVDGKGNYDGRIVRWIDEQLSLRTGSTNGAQQAVPAEASIGPVEDALVALLAGPSDRNAPVLEWEGTRYRLDLSHAEVVRLVRLLGEEPRPYLSSARTLVRVSDALEKPSLTRAAVADEVRELEPVAARVGWTDEDEEAGRSPASARYHALLAQLRGLRGGGSLGSASKMAPALRELADELAARGLLEMTYAAALGQPERAWVSAADSSRRHEFGLRTGGVRRNAAPWRLPHPGGDTLRGWRVVGALLGLDVRLAEFSLVRLSAKPPPRRPTLNEDQRRVFVESVALVEPRRLTNADREAIVSAIRSGRARLASVRTPAEAAAVADAVGLGPARRSLFPWLLTNDRPAIATFLSPSELVRLGLEDKAVESRLQAWGSSGEARIGCLCLQFPDRRPWEMLTGRWGTGILASGFPDLNLRLAEVLSEMKMPAPLLGPVLASATLDFVNTSTSRDQDDRKGLLEFVQAIDDSRVEQYLALLTNGGPLVPLAEDAAPPTPDGPPKVRLSTADSRSGGAR